MYSHATIPVPGVSSDWYARELNSNLKKKNYAGLYLCVAVQKHILAIRNILVGDDPVHGQNILVSAVKIYALEVFECRVLFLMCMQRRVEGLNTMCYISCNTWILTGISSRGRDDVCICRDDVKSKYLLSDKCNFE